MLSNASVNYNYKDSYRFNIKELVWQVKRGDKDKFIQCPADEIHLIPPDIHKSEMEQYEKFKELEKAKVINLDEKRKSKNSESDEKTSEPWDKYFLDTGKSKKYIPAFLGDDILENHFKMLNDGQLLYYYDHQYGYYRTDGEMVFNSKGIELLGKTEYTPNRIENALKYVRSISWNPEIRNIINKDCNIINVKNGLLKWDNGKLYEHNEAFMSTIQLNVEYDESANEPIVIKFLRDVLQDDETVNAVLEFIGYCLIPTTKFQKACMFTGSGSNGKSVLIDMIIALLGHNSCSNVSLQDLEKHKFKAAELENKLLNAFSDIPHTGLATTSTFKTVVRGETLNAERKNGQPFNYRPFSKLLFAANELPASRDLTNGYFRSWMIVKFNRIFAEHEQNENLTNELTTPKALSTLLNLAIQGLKRLYKNGKFTQSESMKAILDKYAKDIDSVVTFVDECCVFDESEQCEKKTLYGTYETWCNDSGLKAMGKIRFNEHLATKFKLIGGRQYGKPEHWNGIRLIVMQNPF